MDHGFIHLYYILAHWIYYPYCCFWAVGTYSGLLLRFFFDVVILYQKARKLKCGRVTLHVFLAQIWSQSFPQGALVSFSGKLYLETVSWVLGVFITTGLAMSLRLISRPDLWNMHLKIFEIKYIMNLYYDFSNSRLKVLTFHTFFYSYFFSTLTFF